MIKNIYNPETKQYTHKYYCDGCAFEVKNGKIARHPDAIKEEKFDLCEACGEDYINPKGEINCNGC